MHDITEAHNTDTLSVYSLKKGLLLPPSKEDWKSPEDSCGVLEGLPKEGLLALL